MLAEKQNSAQESAHIKRTTSMNTKRAPPPPPPPAASAAARNRYPSHRDVVSKIILPGGEDASHYFSFATRGHPPKPTIVSVSSDCPYDLEVGQIVCAVGIEDEFIMGPSTKFLSDVIHEFNFSDQRTILLQRSPHHTSVHGSARANAHNGSEMKPTRSKSAKELGNKSASRSRSDKQLSNGGRSRSAKQLRSSSRKVTPMISTRPGPGRLTLPPGHVGLWFEGSPARLTDVSAGSPVVAEGKGKVGLVVSAVIISGEIEIYGPVPTDDLVELLNEFSDCPGRVIIFDQLQKINLAKEVVSKIHLPTSKCSIQFSGKDRNIRIMSVDSDSRTKKKIKVGQSVRRLEFPGETPYFSSVGAKTLNVLLNHHEKTYGKVLVVGQPFHSASPVAEKLALAVEEAPDRKMTKKSMKNSIRDSIHLLKEKTKNN